MFSISYHLALKSLRLLAGLASLLCLIAQHWPPRIASGTAALAPHPSAVETRGETQQNWRLAYVMYIIKEHGIQDISRPWWMFNLPVKGLKNIKDKFALLNTFLFFKMIYVWISEVRYSNLRNATPGLNSHSMHWLRGLMGQHTFQMSENGSESYQDFTSRSHEPRLNGKCWTKKAAMFLKFLGLGFLSFPFWNAGCLLFCLFYLCDLSRIYIPPPPFLFSPLFWGHPGYSINFQCEKLIHNVSIV